MQLIKDISTCGASVGVFAHGVIPGSNQRHSYRRDGGWEACLTLLEIHAPFGGSEIWHRSILRGELRQSRLAILIQFAEGVLLLLMREERRGLRHRNPAPLTTRQFLQRRSERVLRSPCELALIPRRRVGRDAEDFLHCITKAHESLRTECLWRA